jgi:hypothetical protein
MRFARPDSMVPIILLPALVQKLKGKALYTSVFSVSEDGRTLTETDSETSAGERVGIVYDRYSE